MNNDLEHASDLAREYLAAAYIAQYRHMDPMRRTQFELDSVAIHAKKELVECLGQLGPADRAAVLSIVCEAPEGAELSEGLLASATAVADERESHRQLIELALRRFKDAMVDNDLVRYFKLLDPSEANERDFELAESHTRATAAAAAQSLSRLSLGERRATYKAHALSETECDFLEIELIRLAAGPGGVQDIVL
jgi:hypothetical protein